MRSIGKAFPPLVELYDNTASLQDRTVGTGLARPALVKQYGCGGYIGRASARAFDARVQLSYPPYEALLFNYDVPVLAEGDVNARVWIRIREVEQSLALVEQILARIPVEGAIRVPVTGTGGAGEGLALVEGFRGDVLAWVRLDGRGARRALPPARSLMVSVAGARSRDREQYRRRLPALQQILQLLLFWARSLDHDPRGIEPCFSKSSCIKH